MIAERKEKKMLVEYLRNENKVPRGVVVAVGPNAIGYAMCHKKDVFNRKLGLAIAYDRALALSADEFNHRFGTMKRLAPLQSVVDSVRERAQAYYK